MYSQCLRALAFIPFLAAVVSGCAPEPERPALALGPAMRSPVLPAATDDAAHAPDAAATAAGATASWTAQAHAGIAASAYALQPDGAGFRVTNPAQRLRGAFRERGVAVTQGAGSAEVVLRLRAWGREGATAEVPPVPPEEGPCVTGGAVDAFGACLRRVQYARPGLSEWWENRVEGLEQGFTVTVPPGGEGALVFELAVDGARADVDRDAATFVPAAGPSLKFDQLAAWDETGRSLPTWMEAADEGVRIVVDDDGAVGAVTVDPLLTTTVWTVESNSADARMGSSVASAGDVNADGYDDVIVGAPYLSNGEWQEGGSYLYLGSAAGLSTTSAWTAEADADNALFGASVASAGDVNDDGFGDVLVGASGATMGVRGKAFLYLGSSSGLAPTPAWTVESGTAGTLLGFAVASAGDVNGDGFGDAIIGDPMYSNGQSSEGRVLLYLGSAAGLDTTPAWTAEGDAVTALFGQSIAPAGDVNGDGRSDVLVGAPLALASNGGKMVGQAHLYLGSAAGLEATPAWTTESNQEWAYYGYSVASAGDVNGDSYVDVVVGAIFESNGEAAEGRAYLYLGSAIGLASTASWISEPDQDYAYFGASVATAGDVNGDGFSDVVIGAQGYSNGESSEGRANLYLGSAAGLAPTPAWTAESRQGGASFGNAVGSAGDVNGDGYSDVVVGAYQYSNGESLEGRVYLYLGPELASDVSSGSGSGLDGTATWTAEPNQASAQLGGSVASAGDVNGDGYGDVVVGAYLYSNGESHEGRAYLYLGSPSGLATTAAWFAESNQEGAYFGISVASAGDVNGDGLSDVVVGAFGYSNGESQEGRAYLYLGSVSGLASTPAWTAESDQEASRFGVVVASAGDVNGDGYADVAVGADGYANGEAFEGRAYVFLGSSLGLAPTPAWTAEPDQESAYFGGSVASAGDVNGDGYGDVVVGAQGYGNGESWEGRAFLYFGSSTGLAPAPSWTAESDQEFALFGTSVASAGDVNGDGYGDVVVGAPNAFNGKGAEGRAYLYLGSASGPDTAPASTMESTEQNAYFGVSVASAGDVNGDGFADVAVGATGHSDGDWYEGQACLYLGSAGGLATTPAWTAEVDKASAFFGQSVASAGDVNGDGLGDVVVGAPGYSHGEANEGRAYLFAGVASALAMTPAWTAGSGQEFASFGYSVASAGDVNGDGYADVVVGAYGLSNGEAFEGRVYLFLGSSMGLETTASWTAEADQENTLFGGAIASAGDVNGDGYADVVVGAPGYSHGEANEGRAYLYLGSHAGLDTTPAWTIESDQAWAQLGNTVASAGDVNGDGYGDVVVGAPIYSNGEAFEGRAYLYLGSAAGLSTTAAWLVEGDQEYAWVGGSVASAGDVNGDGYGDVVVGAPLYSNGEVREGRAYLYLGSASGLDGTPSWTAESDQEYALFGSYASAADVNGDGYSDVVVSAFGYSNGEGNEGRAYLYLGSASGLEGTPSWSAESDQDTGYLGPVASADVNGDGFGDVVVAALSYSHGEEDEGRAYLYLGSASGLDTTSTWTVESNEANALFGNSVASAGDVNGDGYGDVVVGAPTSSIGAMWEGRAYVYMGNSGDGTIGVARASQTRQPGTTTPIVPGLSSVSDSAFDVSMAKARGAWGRANVKVQVEVKPLGAAFDGTGLRTQAAYVNSGLSGVSIQQAVNGLIGATGYHWRARVVVAPWEGRPQGWGPWVYGGRSGDATGGHVFTAGSTYYADADGDSYGNAAASITARSLPPGYVTNATDCNDADAKSHPGGTETVADGIDQDCDTVDSCYTDADNDNFGTSVVVDGSSLDCVTGAGAAVATDCDDARSKVNPGETEICDAEDIDEDCDERADDADDSAAAVGKTVYYADVDHDGFGGPVSGAYCDLPAGYVATYSDCNDNQPAIHPGGAEVVADGIDQDCNTVDSCYTDVDGDNYGISAVIEGSSLDCVTGSGAAVATDCNDASAAIHPAAAERVGDAVDQDCDGTERCYVDADRDGARTTFVVPSPDVACSAPGEALGSAPRDCDDSDPTVGPLATELVGTGVDEDCDGVEVCYADADGDGYRPDPGSTMPSADADCDDAGEAPSDAATGDCNDGSTAYHPGASEVDCEDPKDYNCDGSSGLTDGDGDGFVACSECDDGENTVHPDAEEVCDGIDNDCDGTADVDATDASTWYADADGDGYTNPEESLTACDQPEGYAAATEDDCDDTNATLHPGSEEVPGDGVDQDCDGVDARSDSDEGTGGPAPCPAPGDADEMTGLGCTATPKVSSGVALLVGALVVLARRRARSADRLGH